MAHNNLFGAQPFEELVNEQEPTSPTSLEDFYKEQEKKDLERRLSKSRSLRRRKGRSKSVVSTSDGPLSPDTESPRSPTRASEEPQLEPLPEATPPNVPSAPQQLAWHREREQTGQWFPPETIPKPAYEIHNPVTPPMVWTNHHLRPPGAPWQPTSQPRKVTQAQLATQNLFNNAQERPSMVSNNSSSTSFLKTSSAASLPPPAIYGPDHIDIMDPSDPWGMRWHHDSRYDVGDFTTSTRGKPTATWAGTSSPAVELPSRPRTKGSPSGPSPLRSGVKSPSPLSQSTSVVQLKNGSSISLDTPKQLSRRLSKRNSRNFTQPAPSLDAPPTRTRRVSGFRSLFSASSSSSSTTQQPMERMRSKTLGSASASTLLGQAPDEPNRPQSKNLNPPPSSFLGQRSSLTPSPTKDKRSSYLGRLVKKLSIIRHSSEPDPKATDQRQQPTLKRSVSTANGIYASKQPDTGSHPKFASAPDTVTSPIAMVPELRLVEPLSPEGEQESTSSLPKESVLNRPLSEGRNSPESRFAQFGGLVITNPDATASETESLSREPLPPRQRLQSAPSPRPSVPDLDFNSLPRPAFLRGQGIGSMESSPSIANAPLRVVNGREPETETETGTIFGEPISSPLSVTSTIPPPVPSPSDKRKSLQSTLDVSTLSAIPSIPDLPVVSPFNAARSIMSETSPRSSDMATALETLSPPTSALSLSIKPVSSSSISRTLSDPPTPIIRPAAPSEPPTSPGGSVMSVDPPTPIIPTAPTPAPLSVPDEFVRPTPRGSSIASGSRYAAYYSPNQLPSLNVSPAQLDPNPLPTPPARFPIPLSAENASKERLQSSSREKMIRVNGERKSESTKSVTSVETVRDTPYRASPVPLSPTSEKRNKSTFRIPGVSNGSTASISRPSSKDRMEASRASQYKDRTDDNSSRAPIENGYNISSGRPRATHSNSYHLPSSRGESPADMDATAGFAYKGGNRNDSPG
ncbi:hypothetical protein FRC15_001043 [Serendipita sp. 397]|nr:hypothetical protein FRC15_001043 [Serendipita sp. 397]